MLAEPVTSSFPASQPSCRQTATSSQAVRAETGARLSAHYVRIPGKFRRIARESL
jgi:hypothetical protein